jgi:hypothetical protein
MIASLVMVGMLGFAGCGPDNETEGQKTKLGDPGKMIEGTGKAVLPMPSNDERGARGAQGSINAFDAKGKPKKDAGEPKKDASEK